MKKKTGVELFVGYSLRNEKQKGQMRRMADGTE
jgi:hypothetical protein